MNRKLDTDNPFVVVALFIAAVLVFIPLSIIGLLYTTGKHIYRFDYSFKRQFFPIIHALALLLDGMANAMAGELLTDVNIYKDKYGMHSQAYRYGKWYDTISEVTGVNKLRGALTKFGLSFSKLLSYVLEDNHSIASINKDRPYPPNPIQTNIK